MSEFGVTTLSLIPVRTKPSEKSEMSTQLLFGDLYKIKEEQEKWLQITSIFDNYIGWIDKKMHFPVSKEIFNQLINAKPYINQKIINVFEHPDFTSPIQVAPGSSIYLNKKNNIIEIGSKLLYLKSATENPKSNDLSDIAKTYINTPYLWGGRTPFGIDCSGFSQIVYKLINISIPRDASQQVEIGKTIEFMDTTKIGDLAFFDDDEGNITHVGIILANNKIIHASGKVRIDQLDHQGIFNKETNKYSHKLRIIKRIIS